MESDVELIRAKWGAMHPGQPMLPTPTNSRKARSNTRFTLRWVAILCKPTELPAHLADQDVRWMCLARSSRKWLS